MQLVSLFVAVTDTSWFDYLRHQSDLDEVNFWQPGGGTNFRALEAGELFLFKLHSPRNFIVGGGIYYRSLILPISVAWETFGNANGHPTLEGMRQKISEYRRVTDSNEDYKIGCRILTQPFFLSEREWIPVPSSWSRQIVVGKRYTTDDLEGGHLWEVMNDHLGRIGTIGLSDVPQARYGEPALVKPRLGQGAFRIAVIDAYRRCAVTGEKTLPALEASHIQLFARGGEHRIENGLLFRRDIHTLFDRGYVTIVPDGRFEVSSRIKEEYENGRDYYLMQGRKIIEPNNPDLKPSQKMLEWHNSNVFLS